MENQKNTSAPIVMIGFLVIGILLGISFFIYFKSNQPNKKVKLDNSYHSVSLENRSQLVYTVVLPSSEHVDVKPGDVINISMNLNDSISALAYNFDGSYVKYNFKLSNPKDSHLFIGNSGIFSNLTSGDVTFINESKYPIMFIEKSPAGGKRWKSDIVLPDSETKDNFVSKGSTWQVVHPTDEDSPISELGVGYIPKKLVFNGKNLKAI